jgi:alkanesulfonate monooxygenase SsuD/methylene tetrahydromethanopterin reductase-like flavin-dependent oxidoreductase (luciferase family)
MVGGGGERRTLRLVARYADACNVFGGPEGLAHKYRVLREHCEAVGRPYDEIERTTLQSIDPAAPGAANAGRHSVDQVVDWIGELADAGAQHVIFSVRDVWDPARLEYVGAELVPALKSL